MSEAENLDELVAELAGKIKNYSDKNSINYINVKLSGAKGDGISNDSAYFLEDASGYIINDGTYCVDGPTMARLNEHNCIGNGYLKLFNPQLWGNKGSEEWYSPFDYTIAVKDLGNFLKKQMVSASEADYYAKLNRKNATAMLKPLEGKAYAHTIGAVYKIQDAILPDNFTVCIGNLQLYEITSDKILKRLTINKNLKPEMFGIYELPWVPQVSKKLDSSKFKICDDYTEFHLTASDFEGTAEGKDGAVLHFWGSNGELGDRDDIIGVICSFEFWIKEEEARDKLIIQVGVDQLDYNTKTIKQACSGIAMKIENYPRTQWSTSMNREILDKYCNIDNLVYLHNTPENELICNYRNISSGAEYVGEIISMSNGDVYRRLFNDNKTYRGLQLVNPVKHMYLPYCNPSKGSTGNYCKLFSIPKVANSTNRLIFKIDYTRFTSGKVASNISLILRIIKDGSVQLDIISSTNIDYTGAITVLVSDSTIDVYAKGLNYGCISVDTELLLYSSIDNIKEITYDSDLFRVAAGSINIMCEKWIDINKTGCTVIESSTGIHGLSDAKNVKLLGADSKGKTDSSNVIKPVANTSLFFPDGTYLLDYDTIKALRDNASNLTGTGLLKSKDYKGVDGYGKNVGEINTGLIPLDLLTDDIFMSMKMPGDCAGVLNRPYPRHVYYLKTLLDQGKKPTAAHTIFAIYPIPGVTLPDTMTFKIGALKLYGYSKKAKRWVILSENVPFQYNINLHYIENGKWTGNKESIPDCISRTEEEYVTVTIDKERLLKGVVHCGSENTFFNRHNEFPGDIEDYEYIASSCSASCDTDDCAYMTCAVDYVYDNNFYQAYYGRNVFLKNEIQTMWSHNIPDAVYREITDPVRLNQLRQKSVDSENAKYRLLIPGASTSELCTAKDYIPILRVYNGCSQLNTIIKLNEPKTATYREIFTMFNCPSSTGAFPKTLKDSYVWDNSATTLDDTFVMVQDDEDKTSYTLYAKIKTSPISLELEVFYGDDFINYFEFLGKQTQNMPKTSSSYSYQFLNALETYDLTDAVVLKKF